MLYKKSHDVPANTTKVNPSWQKLKVCKGTIEQWIIFCPDECADLMKFRVFYHGYQLLPINEDEWMDALRSPAPIKDNLKLDSVPYVLDVRAYNLDDSYSHEYNLYCNIEPPSPVTPAGETAGMWEKIKGFIGVE